MINKAELKRCPFCGCSPVMNQTGRLEITIKCPQCIVSIKQKVLKQPMEWLESEMIRRWNTRTPSATSEEIEGYEKLISQSSDIMSKTADALKGPPPENTLHSTHDIAEVAAKQAEENKGLREIIDNAIPRTWLDPLLTGSKSPLPKDKYEYTPVNIEALLLAIDKKMKSDVEALQGSK